MLQFETLLHLSGSVPFFLVSNLPGSLQANFYYSQLACSLRQRDRGICRQIVSRLMRFLRHL